MVKGFAGEWAEPLQRRVSSWISEDGHAALWIELTGLGFTYEWVFSYAFAS
jgi:hypothetical protein